MAQRVLAYARQSVEREEGDRSLSIESQLATMREHCQRAGWHIVGEIREAGLKGWMDADERPGLAEAIRRAENGEYDILLVWDLSRLARSVRLQEQWVWQFTRGNVEIVSCSEPDVSNALMRQIRAAINEEKTRDLQRTMRRVLHQKQTAGLHHGRVPWGYLRPDPNGPLIPDLIIAPHVRHIFELRASGVGPAAIARDLAARGVPSPSGYRQWAVQMVCRILACATYRGAIHAGDVWLEECHEAIVPPDLWQRAQEPFQRRAPKRKEVGSWLEGHVEHGCGHPMYLVQSSTRADRPGYVRQPHFRCRVASSGVIHARNPGCTLSPRNILMTRAEELTWQRIVDDLAHLLPPRAVLAAARRQYHAATPVSQAAHEEALARKSRAVARRQRAEDLYLSGARDRAWFDAEDALAAQDAAAADRVLASMPTPPDPAVITAEWETLRNLRSTLREYGPRERGAVLHTLGIAVVVAAGRKSGTGDVGAVRMRYRPALARFFAVDGDR